jgi:hypothetical protein
MPGETASEIAHRINIVPNDVYARYVEDYPEELDPLTDEALRGALFTYIVRSYSQEAYDWFHARGQAVLDSFEKQDYFVRKFMFVALTIPTALAVENNPNITQIPRLVRNVTNSQGLLCPVLFNHDGPVRTQVETNSDEIMAQLMEMYQR